MREKRREAKSRTTHGYTTLESMVVLPAILALIVGVIDLTSMLQGYNALREGVRQSVRCVATTDGRCVSAAGTPATPLYNWYQLGGNQTYFVDRFDLRGHGYHLERARESYAEALVLGAAHITAPTLNFSAQRWRYPGTVRAEYNLLKTSGAYVRGPDRNPQFYYKEDISQPYPASFIQSFVTTAGTNPSQPEGNVISATTDTVTFQVRFAYEVGPYKCVPSAALDNPAETHRPVPGGCGTVRPHRIPALIHVIGEAWGSGTGQVELDFDGAYISAGTEFGGQTIVINSNEPVPHNFVPRGVRGGYYPPSVPSESELRSYEDTIELRPGEIVTVTVKRAAASTPWNSSLRYRVNEIKIVPAIMEPVVEDVSCVGGVSRSSYLNGQPQCQTGYPPHILEDVTVDTTRNLDTSPPVAVSGVFSEAHARLQLMGAGGVGQASDYVLSVSGAGSTERTVACPPNRGVAASADSGGFVRDPSAAVVCPPNSLELSTYGVAPTAVRWSEVRVPLPANARYVFAPATCAESPALPAELLAYRKPIREVTREPFFPPAEISPLDSAFACGSFAVQHVVFDDPTRGGSVPLPTESLFLGTHAEGIVECVAAQLKADAVAHGGLDPRAYFVAESRRVDTVAQSAPPASGCAVYTTQVGSPEGRTLLTGGGPLPRGVTPPECATTPCVAEFARFDGPAGVDEAGLSLDTEAAAAYWGFNEVRSLYPRARWGCSGPECLDLTVEATDTAVTGRGELTVPLLALLGREVTLSFADTRVREASLQR